MSQTQGGSTVKCRHPQCETHGKVWEFHHGKYCSNECEHRHAGFEILSDLKYSHEICFSCFSQLKEIEPPKPDEAFDETGAKWTWDPEENWFCLEKYSQEVTRQAACGFQYLTPNAGKGEKQSGDRVITGTICNHCGNTDHTAHIPGLVDPDKTIQRLLDHLETDDVEVEVEVDVDVEALHREYRDTGDIALALGRAMVDDAQGTTKHDP